MVLNGGDGIDVEHRHWLLLGSQQTVAQSPLLNSRNWYQMRTEHRRKVGVLIGGARLAEPCAAVRVMVLTRVGGRAKIRRRRIVNRFREQVDIAVLIGRVYKYAGRIEHVNRYTAQIQFAHQRNDLCWKRWLCRLPRDCGPPSSRGKRYSHRRR